MALDESVELTVGNAEVVMDGDDEGTDPMDRVALGEHVADGEYEDGN